MGITKSFDNNILEFSSYRTVKNQYTDDFIKFNRCVKYSEDFSVVTVLVSDNYKENIDILRQIHAPKQIEVVTVKDSDFVEFIGTHVEKSQITNNKSKNDNSISLENISNDAPVVNIINAICLSALRKNASDIHIQCDRDCIRIRFRIDGVLQTVKSIDKDLFSPLVSRIKVMSNMNIMENRLCQDGRMSVVADNKNIDFRVSIVPTATGQSVVLRIFDNKNELLELEDLGFSETTFDLLIKSLSLPYGMLLATGPTGSGKTTTLHSLINKMDKEHLKIITIEDPVEKEITGVDQIQVNNEIGLTFENVLRRVLRQDPDVIMIGEIRDKETAELAVRAALTGHLILSTLHTNDSFSAITRLKNLGIDSYLISGVLKICLAQRLVRKTCKQCCGIGCEYCNNTGYKGRTAISEIFEIDDEITKMIDQEMPESKIKSYALKQGFISLNADAKEKVKFGITTNNELLREGIV